jgi:RNA-directed DNA polymerase
VVRYADDFIVTARDKGSLEKAQNQIQLWIWKRYFKTINGNKWTFACSVSGCQGIEKDIYLYPIASTPIQRHIKVKGEVSPDDPSVKEYWDERNQRSGKSYWARGSKHYLIAQNQKWKCPICGEPLLNGEGIEIHHIVPVTQGGLDDITNLQHVHIPCHKQVHSKSKSTHLK